ncbi:hypothetical protein UlMin_001640 [Ulmus minor]
MDFGSNRDVGFSEEDHHSTRGKLPFSYSSSPSSSSSSLVPLSKCPSWDNGPDTKLELMNSSSPLQDNNNNSEGGQQASRILEKEHMFDKTVTPSDVGKLNRLVIPKQHAEKYFPLDSSTNEKGLLLNFEDRNGKPWRFRYSYWNSSQSYVMTKGWSRFVKEKKLDAGDVVSFHRGVGEIGKDHLYIDWRRRPEAPPEAANIPFPFHHHSGRSIPWSPSLMRPPPPQATFFSNQLSYGVNLHPYRGSSFGGSGVGNGGSFGFGNVVNSVCSAPAVFYLREQAPQAGGIIAVPPALQHPGRVEPMVFESVPVVHGKAAAKRLRLFGVNMDCPTSDSDECVTMAMSQPLQLSSSTSPTQIPTSIPLSFYNGTPIPGMPTVDFLNKGKATMSFNFDI